MTPQKEIQLIEEMLKRCAPDFPDAHQRLSWERGFLTGFLASLAHNDSAIKVAIVKRDKK